MTSSNVACHPRVAQLRVYQDLPLEESHPQQCIYPTPAPKTHRSSTKRSASTVDRDQLATCVGVKEVSGRQLKTGLAQSSYRAIRVPFRDIQNNSTNAIDFEPPLKDVNAKKYARATPEQSPHQNAPPRANLKKRPRILPPSSTPSTAPIYQVTRDGTRSTARGYPTVPSLRLYSRSETDHPSITDMSALPPRRATRRAPQDRSMPLSRQGQYDAMDRYTLKEDRSVGHIGRILENEIATEECDISEMDLSDFN